MSDRPIPPGTLVTPGKVLTFSFDGQPVRAYAGQSIGAALYQAGIRIFSRSHKEHRPRGLFCMSGDCANCLMRVDGRDNVRTCVEPVREGQKVVHQRAWPSLDFDVSWLFDTFSRARRRWLDASSLPQPASNVVEPMTAEVCVIGGGPAGLSAAKRAAEAGAPVVLLERLPRLGGHLLFVGGALPELEPVIDAVKSNPRVQVLTDCMAFDLSADLQVGASQGERFLKIQARQVIVCTGGRERPFVFENNDLPGIMLCRAAQRLGRLYGVPAGRKAVVVMDHDDGALMAEELAAFNVEIKAAVDPRPATWGTHVGRGWDSQSVLASKSMSGVSGQPVNWPLHRATILLEAQGSSYLTGVKIVQLNANGSISAKSQKVIECDLLCIASAPAPANELMLLAGVRYQQRDGRWQPSKSVPGLAAAGAAAGTNDLAAQIVEGKLRGAEAAAALGHHDSTPLDGDRADFDAWLAMPRPKPFSHHFPFIGGEPVLHRFVCPCADVTDLQIELALVEGCENVDAVKSYAKVTRGPCQGKMCESACVELCTLRLGENAPLSPPSAKPEPAKPEAAKKDDKPAARAQPRIPPKS